ncbi:PDZ domain-containing protein [Luteolibacter flavescens]|uniref:PDZ domain-containing protein n=1 Tax=Luteolibacter flavescens TaxID=1859460 RepID=A0ABT3FIR6_9BACT|nr:PDZ domain-containing protein [Luteolibacter flavescens]MCW1883342.1 PDZ domain-containing protein [Luteolibacter flavescens]
MKTTLALLAVPFLAVSGLHAQDGPREGQELMDLFERMNRAGTTEADLQKFLENKALLDLESHDKAAEESAREPRQARPPREARERPMADSGPKIGVLVLPLDPAVRAHFGLEEGTGVLVERAMDGGPAARAGIGQNDIIVRANGKAVGSLEDLRGIVESATAGNPAVDLEIIQKGQRAKVTVLVQFPTPPVEKADPAPALGSPDTIQLLADMNRRLDRQQREIQKLRREVERLKRKDSE